MIAQEGPLAPRQWMVLGLVLAALIVDGIDTQLLSLVAPLIMKEWGVDKASFGWAMSAALFGMALGAGVGGGLGDRVGRKTVLVGSTLVFGLGTLAVGLVHSLPVLTALRFASGLGFGALAPNGAALVSEWLPVRLRPRAMALLSITIPMGGLVGGSAVLALLPIAGWRGCFILCGLGTLAMMAAMIALLPESPAYLAARGSTEARAPKSRVFTRANLRLNITAWSAFFCLQLIAYGFIAWTPVMLTMVGWPLAQAIQGTMVFNISAVCASLLAGLLLERMRFRTVALTGALGAIVALKLLHALVTTSPPQPSAVFAAIALVSVLVGIGITSIYTLLPFVYPAESRASGIGMGLMAGRTGGIIIALSGGALLALGGDSLIPFFAVLLLAAALATVNILILGARHGLR
jgi:AAHS family 4-hydroxybenzoate transporter-like MFS transporter